MNIFILTIILLTPKGEAREIVPVEYVGYNACKAEMVATYAAPKGGWRLIKAHCEVKK